MSRVVDFDGPLNAKIYIVGEAPGVEEEALGKPFIGGAGRVLNKMLMDTGINRSECRVGNVMRIRPVNNYFGTFYVDKQMHIPTPALEEGRKYLLADIERVRPNVVVALGNEALSALFHHRGITDWRGSVLWHKKLGVKVVPIVHPAMLMRQWDYAPLVLFDFAKVRKESASPDYVIPNYTFKLAPRFEEVMYELNRLMKVKRIAYDIETTEGNHISAIALADSNLTSICIPFTFSHGTETIAYWQTVDEEIAVMNKIKEVMENENIEKIAQNAQFDNTIFLINPPHIRVANLVLDTMCAFHSIYPELPKGLDVISSIYTRQPYYKHLAKEGTDTVFWKYNCLDSVVTFESATAIEREMKEFDVSKFYYSNVHPLIDILADIQLRGVRVNNELMNSARMQLEQEVAEEQGKLSRVVGYEINVMSPKQLKELLYVTMKLPIKYNRMSGTETTNEKAIDELSHKYPSPIFDLILSIRHKRKLIGTYLSNNVSEDGRIRCSYMIGGTDTGRLSSRESLFGSGTNLQNIPKGVCRKMFVPDEGKVFIEADMSQAEARVVAYLAEEERLIDLFNKGGDIHVQTASWIFGKDVSAVLKEEREMAKKLVHASNYGIGARTFAYHAGVKEGEARLLLQKYFDTFPRIKAWQLQVQSSLSKTRILCTPMGRKRMFFGRWGDELFKQAYAYVPQSTVADVLNLAMIRFNSIQKEKTWHKADVMLQVHDSFVVQCDVGTEGTVIDDIKGAFNIVVSIHNRVFTIPIEIKIGTNWDEMKKYEE